MVSKYCNYNARKSGEVGANGDAQATVGALKAVCGEAYLLDLTISHSCSLTVETTDSGKSYRTATCPMSMDFTLDKFEGKPAGGVIKFQSADFFVEEKKESKMASLATSLVEMPATKEVGPNQWNLMTTYNGSSSKSMDSYNKMSYEDQQAWDQAALESALESSVSMASNEIGRKLKKHRNPSRPQSLLHQKVIVQTLV